MKTVVCTVDAEDPKRVDEKDFPNYFPSAFLPFKDGYLFVAE